LAEQIIQKMKIAISGSGGYIAGKLIEELAKSNSTVIRINRELLKDQLTLQNLLNGTDAVVNLAGAPIFTRWTEQNRKKISESRVLSTHNIVEAINKLPMEKRPKLLISASAIGIYKAGQAHTESNNSFGDDFVSNVARNWEEATRNLSTDVRKVIFRIGLVLGKEAKTIQNLLPLFKLGLGGKLGSGKQPFPFIHINDVVGAMLWAIENEKASGIYNLVAPQHITNEEFTEAFAKRLNRPAFFAVPSFALKIVLGETSVLLTEAPEVKPEKLISEGFSFEYSDIHSTLEHILK
jgi:uncharacterized protein (TIGR01777 family)